MTNVMEARRIKIIFKSEKYKNTSCFKSRPLMRVTFMDGVKIAAVLCIMAHGRGLPILFSASRLQIRLALFAP